MLFRSECAIMEIRIETKEELENKIISMENYYPEEALLFKIEMNTCRNNQMNFLFRYTLPIRNNKFIIELELFLEPPRLRFFV